MTIMTRRLASSLLIALFALAGCVAAPAAPVTTATPTVQLGVKIGQAIDSGGAQVIDAQLTKMAEDAIYQRVAAGMTATQNVISGTATEQKRASDAQATQRADSATQQAWKATIQAGEARDTATAAAQATGTAVAYANATQQVYKAATATAEYRTQQAPFVAANQTAVAVDAEKAVIGLRQTQMTETAFAWGPYAFAFIATILLVAYFYKKSQVGVVMDERGNVRAMIIGKSVLNLDLMLRPVMEFKSGNANAPSLGIDDSIQRQIVHETKIVDAISKLPPPMNAQGMKLLGGMTGQSSGVNIQVVQPQNVQGWLEDVQGQFSERT